MSASKRLRQSILTREKTYAESASALIEPILTSITNISQTTENHLNISNPKESSQASQPVNLQEQRDDFHNRKSKLVHDQFGIISKTTTKNKYANITKPVVDETQNNGEDNWVCPVAVALRRAGYNVPLRPSKSWLERDRKTQALLHQRQTPHTEM